MLNSGRSSAVVGALDTEGRSWIQVMPTATEARNGRYFFTVTTEDLEVYAQSIRNSAGKIPVDYDHAGAEGGSTRAAGWFTGKADVRDDALWAEVEWTSAAQQQIRDGEFRFISPEFTFSERDKKSGLLTKAKDLIAATLTNRPFFSDMPAVTAADLLDDEVVAGLEELLPDAARLIVLALAGDVDAVRAAVWTTAYVNNLPDSSFLHVESGGSKDSGGKTEPRSLRHFPVRDDTGAVDLPHLRNALSRIPQASLPAGAKQAATRKAQQLMRQHGGAAATSEGEIMELKAMAAALGLPEDADEETVLEAAKAARAAAEAPDPEPTGPDEETLRQLVASAAKGEQAAKELHDMRRDQLLTDAVKAGKILPVQKDSYASMYDADPKGVTDLIDVTPARSFREIGSSDDARADELDSKAVSAAKNRFAFEDYEVPDAQAAAHVKALEILGKPEYTADEYVTAYTQAEKQLATS